MQEYHRGWDDAMEICTSILEDSDNIASVKQEIEYLRSLRKEQKEEELLQQIGAYRIKNLRK